eukprot:192267-Chlamydomonas_euryale.AAC.1
MPAGRLRRRGRRTQRRLGCRDAACQCGVVATCTRGAPRPLIARVERADRVERQPRVLRLIRGVRRAALCMEAGGGGAGG